MSKDYLTQLDPVRQDAVNELINLVEQRYPTASFAVEPGTDDPDVTHITATINVDDPV